MKQFVKTDWVSIEQAVRTLREMGVERTFGTVYFHVVSGTIQSKFLDRGLRKQYLVYIPSLKEYGASVLEREGTDE